MVIGKVIDGSIIYAKEGLLGKWDKWILLIVSCIIFPLLFIYAREGLLGKWDLWILLSIIISFILFLFFMGYTMRIYRGANPAPALDDRGGMFIDGIKLLVVWVIYALPVIILFFVLKGSTDLVIFSLVKTTSGTLFMDPGAVMGLLEAIFFGAIIIVIVAIIIGLITATATVRFARTSSFSEAFNFGAIFAHIGKIGWMTYIIALIMLGIIVGIVEVICMVIPYIGIVLLLILLPFLGLLSARYLTLLYESAGPV
jgi:hypothetical protein